VKDAIYIPVTPGPETKALDVNAIAVIAGRSENRKCLDITAYPATRAERSDQIVITAGMTHYCGDHGSAPRKNSKREAAHLEDVRRQLEAREGVAWGLVEDIAKRDGLLVLPGCGA
jgi:hypothetical protein